MVRRILSPDDLPEEPFDADRTFARCVAAGLLLGVVFILSESHGCGKSEPVAAVCQNADVEAHNG